MLFTPLWTIILSHFLIHILVGRTSHPNKYLAKRKKYQKIYFMQKRRYKEENTTRIQIYFQKKSQPTRTAFFIVMKSSACRDGRKVNFLWITQSKAAQIGPFLNEKLLYPFLFEWVSYLLLPTVSLYLLHGFRSVSKQPAQNRVYHISQGAS